MEMMFQKKKKDTTVWKKEEHLLTVDSPFSVREAYKTLRTNLFFSIPDDGCKTIVVTSSMQHEGKSITSVNLGIAIAETRAKVLLIDCDLRLPTCAQKLGARNEPGLTNLLIGMCAANEVIRKHESGLDYIPAGYIPPNPSEMLGANRMKIAVSKLAEYYDYILLDTPPVCTVADAAILSKIASGVVVVTRQGVSTDESITAAMTQLELAGAKVLGFVLTGGLNEGAKSYRKKGSYSNGYAQSYAYAGSRV